MEEEEGGGGGGGEEEEEEGGGGGGRREGDEGGGGEGQLLTVTCFRYGFTGLGLKNLINPLTATHYLQLQSVINPFSALACKLSGLKSEHTSRQTEYFPVR